MQILFMHKNNLNAQIIIIFMQIYANFIILMHKNNFKAQIFIILMQNIILMRKLL